MAVLIECMEMPRSCDDCPFYFFGWYKSHEKGADEDFRFAETCLASYRRGLTGIRTDNKYTTPKGMKCPLTELPDRHGRLIDADEMFVEFVIEGQRSKRYKLGEKWELNGEEIRSVISRLPTIIQASEKEE